MSQTTFPFKYEEDNKERGVTSLGGLPLYLSLANVIGLSKSVREHIQIRESSQGWTDTQVIMSLILLNLSGGDCVEDLNILEADEGFCRILRRVELSDLSRKQRRKQERRRRKEKRRTVPSPSAVFRYLEAFHNKEEEKKRVRGKAFIPASNKQLMGFGRVNGDLMAFTQRQGQDEVATLDMDATLVETQKEEAFYTRSLNPINR